MSTENRPPIAQEVRAWILATVVIIVHTVSIVWWAATLNTKMDFMGRTVVDLSISIKEEKQRMDSAVRELEIRVRELEKKNHKFGQ